LSGSQDVQDKLDRLVRGSGGKKSSILVGEFEIKVGKREWVTWESRKKSEQTFKYALSIIRKRMKAQMVLLKMFCDMFLSNLTVPYDPLEPERRNVYVLAGINYLNEAFGDEDHKDVQPVLYQVVGQEVISQVGQEVVSQMGQEVVDQTGQEEDDSPLDSDEEGGSSRKRQKHTSPII